MQTQDSNTSTDVLGEDTEMTVQELYAQLLLSEELILTVERHAVEEIKKSLISVKGKQNTKLRNMGMPVDNTKLSVTELPRLADTPEQLTRIHIVLAARKSFPIAKIEKPSGF